MWLERPHGLRHAEDPENCEYGHERKENLESTRGVSSASRRQYRRANHARLSQRAAGKPFRIVSILHTDRVECNGFNPLTCGCCQGRYSVRVLILVDCYLPSQKSGAKQIHDLGVEFARQGCSV